MRPNLLPLGLPIGIFLLCRPEHLWSERVRAAGAYAAGAALGCLGVAAIQNVFYGSPFSSGYGSLDAYFSLQHIRPNAQRYFSWMTSTHTPVWLVAAAAPFALPGALSILLSAVVLVTVVCYLPYAVFDDWAFLRFLLPAIPIVLILMMAAIDAACRRVRVHVAWPVTTGTAVVVAALCLSQASDRSVFRLHLLEARFARAGMFVGERLPANALVFTSWQSGSVRHYAGRRTLVWDGLDPAWLDRAIAFSRERGLQPFLLFERWEEPLFRQRFIGSETATLDWPPMAEIGGQVRVYRPEDRERYRQGLPVPTEYAR